MKKIIFSIILLAVFKLTFAQTKPYQFIAKMYTESFGRIPDVAGWNYYKGEMDNATNLKQWMISVGRDFYKNSAEFTAKYPLPTYKAARIIALYRGALNREPEKNGFDSCFSKLNSETNWNSMVDEFFSLTNYNGTISEFSILADSMIAKASRGNPYYGWWNTPILSNLTSTYPTTGIHNESELRTAIAAGGTVVLPQMAVIQLTSQLVIPANVTITTYGNPTPEYCYMMARIIRGDNYTFADNNAAPLILLSGNNTCLQNVWVDGQVEYFQNNTSVGDSTRIKGIYNIKLFGTGSGNRRVRNCRVSETCGFTNIFIDAWDNSTVLDSIVNNLITCYGSDHEFHKARTGNSPHIQWWVDGISINRNDVIVKNNSIIDATDVGIVAYFNPDTTATNTSARVQNSKITYNMILNSGNSCYAGLCLDPYINASSRHYYDFTNCDFSNNVLLTSPGAHMDMGISVGSRSWFYGSSLANIGFCNVNNGTTSITYNNLSITANFGILVNGMRNVTINNNVTSTVTDKDISFPTSSHAKLGYNSNSAYASFNGGTVPSGFIPFSDSDLFMTAHENILWNSMSLIKKPTVKTLQKGFNSLNNYPNPFNPTTNITYSLQKPSWVKLQVYNILGQNVANLVNAFQEAGSYSILFNASIFASGTYIISLQSNGDFISKKMALLK